MFEKNNPTIALNVLYEKEMESLSAYFSKINSNCETKNNSNNSLNDPKRRKRRLTLYSSKRTICIIERNNSKTL